MSQSRQRIRFLRTDDGAKLAWAEAGSGQLLIKAANWMSHLEYEWESPVWNHWLHFFTDHFRWIRYDERGCGMSDWEVGDLTLERWVADLEAVVEAAQPARPFVLLGVSQGSVASIAYAVRHPERVSHLILYGGYARGAFARGNPELEAEYRLVTEAIRVGWGKDNPAFRQLFTSRFIPGGTPEQIAWFNELCRRTTSGEIAVRLLKMRAKLDVRPILDQIRVPTLIIHVNKDSVCPVAESRLMASAIPGAQYVELESQNHVLLAHEPAWQRFQQTVLEFVGQRARGEAGDPFVSLSRREREVLSLLTEGLDNSEIGARLSIAEKTVRNHISAVYDKLGVWSRAQAIVFARDHGFRS